MMSGSIQLRWLKQYRAGVAGSRSAPSIRTLNQVLISSVDTVRENQWRNQRWIGETSAHGSSRGAAAGSAGRRRPSAPGEPVSGRSPALAWAPATSISPSRSDGTGPAWSTTASLTWRPARRPDRAT